ncbi:PH domain-containing protein [Paenibacillus apiarius]|uniref:PH domain-containing protein n=1 Tax=Paenibacillus apiarius TaxID=46240 RepID=A0ABT4DX51_9BACL|nr:PH domain-containing protein [Paenibacillus apiarius]MCY9516840.1 PH domain-containing protein [Paenibacillus apiarius]MCY9521933.1 PH domain-containing protein [Paenibacillus apiarius]MCY9550479.1 PH domain-containing protein [Paenibacillus apiarius]MCY9559872.1 PH domain-containing protein [Paenibacillus apiarius]MCY9683444.1 PH domain-containing protein [Paenibacillus apiarius]
MYNRLTHRLHPDYVKAARIRAFLTHLVLFAMVVAYVIVARDQGWVLYPARIALVLFLVTSLWYIVISPVLTYSYFKYEVREEEVEIQSGIFFRKHILVPMTRVQHVEKASGPVLRKFGLAKISIATAATTHEIEGLQAAAAEALKQRIAVLARVEDDDE